MKLYKNWAPSQHDIKGLNLADRQEWFVAPVIHTRDSDALERSNYKVILKELEKQPTSRTALNKDELDYEVHSFNHWACGFFEIILVRPGTLCDEFAEKWEDALQEYPIADEFDYSNEENEEAQEVWTACYSDKERLKYIRGHRSQFEFNSWMDLLKCVRGEYFCGYASELIA